LGTEAHVLTGFITSLPSIPPLFHSLDETVMLQILPQKTVALTTLICVHFLQQYLRIQ